MRKGRRRSRRSYVFFEKLIQSLATLFESQLDKGFSIFDEQIENDQLRRRFLREPADAAFGRVDALEQGIEGKVLSFRNDDFAVEDKAIGFELRNRVNKLREISRQRLAALGLKRDLFAVFEDQSTKPIPFRLILPVVAARNLRHGRRFHWRVR